MSMPRRAVVPAVACAVLAVGIAVAVPALTGPGSPPGTRGAAAPGTTAGGPGATPGGSSGTAAVPAAGVPAAPDGVAPGPDASSSPGPEAGPTAAAPASPPPPPAAPPAATDVDEDAGVPGGLAPAGVVLTSVERLGDGHLRVGGYVQDVLEPDGTCVATASAQGASYSASSRATPEATMTDCGPMDIAVAPPAGPATWTVQITYRSSVSAGTSPATKVEMP
ncbi:hypothetical protein [Cellulomonas aerilata]|uniref:Uncharacterized protein n=1 Tax=Cellulomonas aerilata TaxID=515326 RepID=A0A512DDF4_9CELL|nr:hypothetical protein [Cellulomonas aerilata]GEO34467.1 hypothetical protein CAE01nite_21920 [Cellulomonas aerilata]